MGLFADDPYSDFGRLLYEMWRSTRLVVDTGMHALGWSRERAIGYMQANTALSELNIVREVDRYIDWPGQACGYKIGELRIRAMRERAERELGTGFDVRAFHDELLGAGALPLDVLEARMDAWVRGRAAQKSQAPS
jgi:prolyl oligopeptidase